MSRKKKFFAIFFSLAVIGTLAWVFMPKPIQVEIAEVSRGAFRKTIDEDGKTRVRERYVISTPVAGKLLRIQLKAGDPIRKGTLLATIVPSIPSLLDARSERELTERVGAVEAELQRAGAALARAQVSLEQAKSDLERAQQLRKSGFISATELERNQREVQIRAKELNAAQFENHAAGHNLAQARAALSRLRNDPSGKALDRTWEIRSPVAGQVLRVLLQSETTVAVGAGLVEIADPKSLEVVVDVLTSDSGQIKPGATVHIDRGDESKPLVGTVRLVEPAAFTKISSLGVEEQRVNVIIDFVSPTEEWQNIGDNHRVNVSIDALSMQSAIKVPASALFRLGSEDWAVFAVVDGKAVIRKVELGPRNANETVVVKGLEPGQQVITYPHDEIKDGVRVKAGRQS